MNSTSRLNLALSYLADRFVIGTLVVLLSSVVVTIPAALAAGISATRETTLRAAVPGMFRAFRRHLLGSVKLGLLAAVMLASSTVNALWLLSPIAGLERVVAYACVILTILASVATLALGAVLLDMGARISMRNVVMLLGACPGAFMLVVALLAIGLVVAGIAPLLALPVTGAVVQVLLGVRVRYERQTLPRTAAR